MTLPRWLLIPLTTIMALGLGDRIHVEHRLSTVEAAYVDIQQRLDRIEGKVDTLIERGTNAR